MAELEDFRIVNTESPAGFRWECECGARSAVRFVGDVTYRVVLDWRLHRKTEQENN